MTRLLLSLAIVVVAGACSAAEAVPTTTTDAGAPETTAAVVSGDSTLPPATRTSTTSLPPTTTTTTTAPDPGYPEPTDGSVDRWVPEVRAAFPHDPAAFTQGLVLSGGVLYESTGLYGDSRLRRVDVESGEVIDEVRLGDDYFGEGLALVGGNLVQLTWREGTAFIWDAATLEPGPTFTYRGEGWGLCEDGERLVMTDGSATLEFRDAATFESLGEVTVTRDGAPVEQLNELECVDGRVFANVWQTSEIVVIEPATGVVTAVIDASALDEWSDGNSNAVLNGIAHDAQEGVFYVTGKLWPTMFEVVFVAP